MFAQSSSFVPNKKQSAFSVPIHHNFSLLATRNYSKLTKMFADVKANPASDPRTLHNNPSNASMNLLDIVCSCLSKPTLTSGLNLGRPSERQNLQVKSSKPRNNCKELIEVSSMPFVSSYLVGGFVGSKSQLGRHPSQRLDVKMWDIIRGLGLLNGFGNNPNVSKKGFGIQNTSKRSELHSLTEDSKSLITRPCCITDSSTKNYNMQKEPSSNLVSKKQSYADVAKTNLPMTRSESQIHSPDKRPNDSGLFQSCYEEDEIENCKLSSRPTSKVRSNVALAHIKDSKISLLVDLNGSVDSTPCEEDHGCGSAENSSVVSPVLKSILKKGSTLKNSEPLGSGVEARSFPDQPDVTSFSQNRGRIVSQCSDDSESSFIVFEHSEDDTSSVNNDGSDDSEISDSSYESDEDSLLTTEDPRDQPSQPSSPLLCSSQTKPQRKRVRFAEGADLVTVLEVDSVETGGRSEWELHALDCWRFRQRIQETEASLQSVLEPAHRHRIYQERFADSGSE